MDWVRRLDRHLSGGQVQLPEVQTLDGPDIYVLQSRQQGIQLLGSQRVVPLYSVVHPDLARSKIICKLGSGSVINSDPDLNLDPSSISN
jgi:hypothetical protein